MNCNRLVAWFRDRKAEIGQAIAAARSEPGPESSPEWFAGLVVSPASFSRQLGDMQLSLMRANEPRAGEPRANEPRRDMHGSSQADKEVGLSQQRV